VGSGSIGPPFMTSALDGGEWSASRLCCFTPWIRALDSRWTEGWVGPSFCLEAMNNRKILHCREPKPGCPTRSPSLYRLSYCDSTQKWDLKDKAPRTVFIDLYRLVATGSEPGGPDCSCVFLLAYERRQAELVYTYNVVIGLSPQIVCHAWDKTVYLMLRGLNKKLERRSLLSSHNGWSGQHACFVLWGLRFEWGQHQWHLSWVTLIPSHICWDIIFK
jgi:hypothetical protein